MFNFSKFCKDKKCKHYKEWHIQAGKGGMVRCCELVGQSFYITTFPANCIHLTEIAAAQKYEREKHVTWKRLTKKSSGEELQDRVNRSTGNTDYDTTDGIF